jgi:hyperosmotically inducible protein
MNKDILSGKWKQLRGTIQEKWGRLTDDDLDQIDGQLDRLLGTLQERYGWARDRAEQELEAHLDAEETVESSTSPKSGWPVVVLLVGALLLGCAKTDSGVTVKVKGKLASDDTVKATQIDVTTRDHVVTLTGTVNSEAERERAIELARSVEGVRDVQNMIVVRESDGSGDAPDSDRTMGQVVDDAGITAAVKAKLLDDPAVRGLQIDVDTREGVVYLTGTVRSDAEKSRAIDLARSTENVRDVQADLRIGQS